MTNPERNITGSSLQAGSAVADLTPKGSVFLSGYPRVARYSTGVHDRLRSVALFLREGRQGQGRGRREVLFIANDLLFVGRNFTADVRRMISRRTGIAEECVIVAATHTHSGPLMVDYVSNSEDKTIPKAEAAYLSFAAAQMTEAACAAIRDAEPAEAGLAMACAQGVGTNRHDPAGPSDPEVPVLVVRSRTTREALACMIVYAMHPTVLHEDSTLISADFPHFVREYLRECGVLPPCCPILYFNGASGNQSPRHVTRENTFAEARRLGELLGGGIARVIPSIKFTRRIRIDRQSALAELELRDVPPLEVAIDSAARAKARLAELRDNGAPRAMLRTAECDWFGAEKNVVLARAASDGRLADAVAGASTAELQVITIGQWRFVTWPGEFFVEYALAVKERSPDTFVITLANGELQGYIVTPDAVEKGYYEATNALFAASNGARVVRVTLAMLAAAKLGALPCRRKSTDL